MGIHKPTTPAVSISGYPQNTLPLDSTYASNSIHMTYGGDQAITGGSSLSANNVFATMFIAKTDVTIDGLCVENFGTGDASKTAVLGLWNSDGNYQPDNLVGQTGVITLDGNATVRVADTASDINLTRGLYWAGLVVNSASQWVVYQDGSRWQDTDYGNMIWAGGNFAVSYGPMFYKSFTYNATLQNLDGGVTWHTLGPAVGLRVK